MFVIVIIGYIILGTVGEFHTLLLITQSIIMTHNHTAQTWKCARVMICSGLVVACKCELLTYPVLASCTTQTLYFLEGMEIVCVSFCLTIQLFDKIVMQGMH